MKEIDTETTVVWPAWCYSGKSCRPTAPRLYLFTCFPAPKWSAS